MKIIFVVLVQFVFFILQECRGVSKLATNCTNATNLPNGSRLD
jgi:hypothetical protein